MLQLKHLLKGTTLRKVCGSVPKSVWRWRFWTNETIPTYWGTKASYYTDFIINYKWNLQSILLYGVTGSGKTEVYLQSIAAVLEKGKSYCTCSWNCTNASDGRSF